MATLMIQGTSSDAGKTTLVTALCRLMQRRGITVAPFKPQNMALNSAVTKTGDEIGRAQALQAKACGIEPTTDMNPVLIKPTSDTEAQVIVNGRVAFNLGAKEYHHYKQTVFPEVLKAYYRLQQQYDVVLVEGAGSPAEINLRDNDIANMGFAEVVDCPVILIADIERGGVFAQCVGTLELLSQSERDRIHGFVINRFHGDMKLLDSGLRWLEEKTKKPVLGVLPFVEDLYLSAEDGIDYQQHTTKHSAFKIIIPLLPRISNHTDFDVLRLMPEIDVQFIKPNQKIPAADLIILPGSKNTIADLIWLREHGWEKAIKRHVRFGGKVMGICAGLQMLGETISDPFAVESTAGSNQGLDLLDVKTVLQKSKQLKLVGAQLTLPGQQPVMVKGYEIHAGETTFNEATVLTAGNQTLGVLNDSQQVLAVYLHGIFDQADACQSLLQWAGLQTAQPVNRHQHENTMIDRMSDCCELHLNMPLVEQLLNPIDVLL